MGNSTTPLISCVMPTYGRPAYVGEALAMFLAQDYPVKELIVLNDCAGQEYYCDLTGVRVVNRDKRFRTLGDKRNAAIELAAGEIIAIWDDDDVYLPWRLSLSLREMERWDTEFYRPATFWAYWGDAELHDNSSVDGWLSHGTAAFTKDLWRRAGKYPSQGVGEDAVFFRRIHQELGEEFIKYAVDRENRFFVLRGTSQYHHMSIAGGQQPLDCSPGNYQMSPSPIRDPVLRQACERLVGTRAARLVDVGSDDRPAVARPVLSVCVSLKNRSRIVHQNGDLRLFEECVKSLAAAARAFAAEGPLGLVVADFRSNDWPLDEWIQQAAGPLDVQVVPVDGDFSRGRGLNVAARHARSERLFFCDADMLVTPELLRRGLKYLERGAAFFPIFRYIQPDGSLGAWEVFSYGNVFVTRTVWEATGGWPEFKSWGGEDDVFRDRVAQQVVFERDQVEGFHHQWHPDRCRHDQYVRRRKADYEEYCRTGRSGTTQNTRAALYGEHPHWRGKVILLANGRMMRPGIDSGSYDLQEHESLTLKWDRWAPETLIWDAADQLYRDPTKAFTLRELDDPERK